VVSVIIDNQIWTVNAGDSRSVVCEQDTCYALSMDHKPDNFEENERIVNAGSYVSMGRVNGSLAMSRALGDFTYKDLSMDPKETAVTA